MAAMKRAKASEEKTEITIPAIDLETAMIKIVGDSPLIIHKWSEKAKREILEKQMKTASKSGKEAKSPVQDFINSMYWLDGEPEEKTEEGFAKAIQNGARFGFPATAVKQAAVSAAYRSKLSKDKVSLFGAFRILGEFIEIEGVPRMREDMVKIAGGVADIRYRGEFPEWSSTFTVEYNKNMLSLSQLMNMVNLGGFSCGIGEWRVEKGGNNGAFHVE